MSLRTFFRRSHSERNNQRRTSFPRARHLPGVELLEDRRLLSLTPAFNYAGSTNGYAIGAADFNNDGNLDLATLIGYSSNTTVSVRLGDGAGGFGSAHEFAAPLWENASSIFIADLNNDARPDVVVSEFNGFSTLIGNGNGTFQSALYTGGVNMAYVGHFYHDSSVVGLGTWLDGDWAVHIQVYSGNGQGGFVPVGYDAQYWGYGGVAPVDLNNDGAIDVFTGEGLVFLNVNGILEFDWDQQASLSGGAIATADFTGDGNADVIVAGNDVAVLRGRGDGRLDAPIHFSTNGSHTAVTTADFNADGMLDGIVTNRDDATVSVMLGNGDGTLRFGGAFATGTLPSSLAVGDFNRDGRPDVAVANAGSNSLSVLLNDGDWTTVPPAPSILSISDTTVTEGDTGTLNATFTVTLTQPSAVDVTLRYSTANITATELSDYVATSGTLTIPPGQTSQTFTVPIKGDRIAESTETFAVNLSTPTNAPIGDGQGIGTILDNEPRVSINDVSLAEGDSKTPKSFTFTVGLSAAYDQAVTVNYATANGTATAGNDYQSKTGSVTFAPGETTKTITVAVIGDKQKESNETFFVNLSAPASAAMIDSQGLATILNDDSAGPKGNRHLFALAVDAAIDNWMFISRTKRAR